MEALRPCGLAARSDSEPLWKPCGSLEAVRAGSDSESLWKPCGSLEAVRAGSPQRLRAFVEAAFVEALGPCGLAARSDSEPLWEALGWQPAATQSLCGSLVEALRPCGLAARSDSELCGSLVAVRAGSPQRLRAFAEALWKP